MKIRNIVFSGFMASILMVGGAYAATGTELTTKSYVDGAYTAAKALVTSEAARADTAEKANASAISDHKANTVAHITAEERTAWNAAEQNAKDYAAGLNSAMTSALNTAKTDLTTAIGTAKLEAISAAAEDATTKASEALNSAKSYVNNIVTGLGEGGIAELQSDVNTLKSEMTDAQGDISDNAGAIDDLTTRMGAAETNIDTLQGTVTDLNTNKANSADVYTTTDADAKFAEKATTLAGYGIGNAYTKTEVDTALNAKANAANLVCGEAGDLCYVNHSGQAVKISTIDVFSAGSLN